MPHFRPVCLLIVLLLAATARGQESSESKKEIWPEFDVYFPLNERFRFEVSTSYERAEETKDNLEGQVSGYLDYFLKDRITLRAGYRYGFSLGGNDSPFKEHRIIFEQVFHKPLSHNFVFSDRNRQELRWVNGDFSLRFRNRPKLERAFRFGSRSLVPYGSGEIFYDSRFNTFNRFRFRAGTEIVFARREFWRMNVRRERILDLYYMWQRDSRSQPERLQVLGITFEIHF